MVDFYGNPKKEDVRQLQFLPITPFAGQGFTISGEPIRIVDHTSLNTSNEGLTLPLAVATTLWNWCPDALSAFLDKATYSKFDWNCYDCRGHSTRIRRNKSWIRISNRFEHGTLYFSCEFKVSRKDGRWDATACTASSEIVHDSAQWPALARRMSSGLLVNPRWKVDYGRCYRLVLTGATIGQQTYSDDFDTKKFEPYRFYRSICQRCFGPTSEAKKEHCRACLSAWDCSNQCRANDWAVHKGTCEKIARVRNDLIESDMRRRREKERESEAKRKRKARSLGPPPEDYKRFFKVPRRSGWRLNELLP